MKDIKQAAWLWTLGYCMMTIAAIIFTIALAVIFELPSARELQVSVGSSPIYSAAMPFHWLITLPFWIHFGRKYLLCYDFPSVRHCRIEALKVAALWTLLSVISDFLVWIVAPSPMQMTAAEMYVRHGLWSLLVYVAVFGGTLLSAFFIPEESEEFSD